MENFKELNNITNCKECFWYTRCKQYGENINRGCNDFDPLDVDTYCANIESYLKEHVSPTSEKRMSLRASAHKELGVRDESSLASYYCEFINDSVHEIKKGHITYVFKISQIADIMKFLPNVHITDFKDGIYYLTM